MKSRRMKDTSDGQTTYKFGSCHAAVTLPAVVTTAPIGNPLPMPFAMVTISGTTS